jgi:hypothetical protein
MVADGMRTAHCFYTEAWPTGQNERLVSGVAAAHFQQQFLLGADGRNPLTGRIKGHTKLFYGMETSAVLTFYLSINVRNRTKRNQKPFMALDETQVTEAGEVDNRLSLDPNDDRWPAVAEWEDSKEYTLTVKVRQLSPGEFEVLEAEPSEAETPEPEEAAAEEEDAEEGKKYGTSNPAVVGLIVGKKK